MTLAHSNGQGQGDGHFDNDYRENGDIYGQNFFCHQIASHVWAFDRHIYIRPRPILKGQDQCHAHFDNECLGNDYRHGKITIAINSKSYLGFRLTDLHLVQNHDIDQRPRSFTISTVNILELVIDRTCITIVTKYEVIWHT